MYPKQPGKETILVADDEAGVRRFCTEILEECGYRVLAAENGRHALEVAQAAGWSMRLLLSDMTMPEMDGPDLAKQLRVIVPDVRIVFMSANYGKAQAALTDGCHFLCKPFAPDKLIETVYDALVKPPMPLR